MTWRATSARLSSEESCEGIPDDLLFIVDECTDGVGPAKYYSPRHPICIEPPRF
jgi:hypothetical protein